MVRYVTALLRSVVRSGFCTSSWTIFPFRQERGRRGGRTGMVSCERLEYRALLSVSTVSPWHLTEPVAQSGQVSYLTATDYESYTLDIAALQQSLSAAPDEFSGTSGIVIDQEYTE